MLHSTQDISYCHVSLLSKRDIFAEKLNQLVNRLSSVNNLISASWEPEKKHIV